MGTLFVIDCGSRSIKLHEASGGSVTLAAMRSWDPIGDAGALGRVGELFAELTQDVPRTARVHVVGTAAARRDHGVAEALGQVCRALGWSYQTLTHASEAELIRDAFGAPRDRDIVNAGGGSIEIVRPKGAAVLLDFGITDLNRRFGLMEEPARREVAAARAFVRDALPALERPFIYSGGELSYLRALGARIGPDGRCDAAEFERIASRVDGLDNARLETLSPFDPGWMHGAVASNAIVAACLAKSGLDHYYASDVNIADGIVAGLAWRAQHAPDPGL
ncbi:MAG TPA: exopolyphosphatase [Alphaproteobacteria bacterium]|nr:exopolyphosphatase [Alphaproteobacteria bacterium]